MNHKKVKGFINVDITIINKDGDELIVVEIRLLGFLIKRKTQHFITAIIGWIMRTKNKELIKWIDTDKEEEEWLMK